MLENGVYPVPPGKVAAVVTHLEMHARPETRPAPVLDSWQLVRVTEPRLDWYRALMREVGEDWLWWSRRAMDDATLGTKIGADHVKIWTLRKDEADAALLELQFDPDGRCHLAYFGLAPQAIGQGAGRHLMNTAIAEAWSEPIKSFHVQTCTLDSPQALAFYIRSGFEPARQEIEVVDDPRLTGVLARGAAPHWPIIEAAG